MWSSWVTLTSKMKMYVQSDLAKPGFGWIYAHYSTLHTLGRPARRGSGVRTTGTFSTQEHNYSDSTTSMGEQCPLWRTAIMTIPWA
jgi:hypothetical protein